MSIIKVGEKAPSFTLKDQHEKELALADLKGRKVLLSFHPLAWTSVCAEQMKSLEQNEEKFHLLNTVALGISVDAVPCKLAWAEQLGIRNTRLLSDFWPQGEAAKKFGILREKNGFSERANIIIDEHQNVSFAKVYPIRELPDIQEIISLLEEM